MRIYRFGFPHLKTEPFLRVFISSNRTVNLKNLSFQSGSAQCCLVCCFFPVFLTPLVIPVLNTCKTVLFPHVCNSFFLILDLSGLHPNESKGPMEETCNCILSRGFLCPSSQEGKLKGSKGLLSISYWSIQTLVIL